MTPSERFVDNGGQIEDGGMHWNLFFCVDPRGTVQTARHDKETEVYALAIAKDADEHAISHVFQAAYRQMSCMCACRGKQIRGDDKPIIITQCEIHGI